MKCKWEDCENEARAKSPFCGDTCKKRHQRASGTDVPVEVGQGQVGQPVYVPVEGEAVYGRQAVSYPGVADFETRPEPLDPADSPKPQNRGKYIRPDGTEYQSDSQGSPFECQAGPPGEPAYGHSGSWVVGSYRPTARPQQGLGRARRRPGRHRSGCRTGRRAWIAHAAR